MPLGKHKKKTTVFIFMQDLHYFSIEWKVDWNETYQTHCETNCSKTKTISEEEVDDQRIINSKKPIKHIAYEMQTIKRSKR